MAEKILVVDDDVDSLKLIGMMLQRQGYDVIAANAGQPALQKAFNEHPDLIILDVMMPDMDGFEVCRRLREENTTANIPIIMFTAKTMVDDKVTGFEAGADDYLTKPTHPAELSSRVRSVLQRSQQKRNQAADERAGGFSIGFVGIKGGVGTTTLAANVGTLLAQRETTILTDLRLGQGTLGLYLGFGRSQGLSNVLSQPVDDLSPALIEENLVQHNSGLQMLLASPFPSETRLELVPDTASALLQTIATLSHFRLFDLGAGWSEITMRLASELDHVVIVVEPNRLVLALAREMLYEFENLGIVPARTSMVIFNRVQSTEHVPWQEVEQMLNHEVTAIISPDADLAARAIDAGMPMVGFQPSSIVAGQLSKFVEEIVKRRP